MNSKLVLGTTAFSVLISWHQHIFADLYIKLPQLFKGVYQNFVNKDLSGSPIVIAYFCVFVFIFFIFYFYFFYGENPISVI